MDTDRSKLLKESFSDVLQRMAFMFAENGEKSRFPLGVSDYVSARMSFAGDIAGSLTLAIPYELSAEIAANILGIEPNDVQAQRLCDDALQELMNVVCGTLLRSLTGPKALFRLSSPVTFELDSVYWKSLLDTPDSLGLLVDNQPVLLWLCLRA